MFNLKPNRAKVSPVICFFHGSKKKGSANMPTKRILLTLGDIKEIVAKKYKTPAFGIEIFNRNSLIFEDSDTQLNMPISEDTYLFQIDFEAK